MSGRQPALRMPLDDALDSVLAEDIVSRLDIPAWTNSAMDGYAARGEDVRGATEAPAGPAPGSRAACLPDTFPTRAIGPGECARIFTGAPLPEGADSVIRQEDTDWASRDGHGPQGPRRRVNIRRTGEDVRKGSTVLDRGHRAGSGAAGRAGLPRGGAPAGVPPAPGGHPRQRRRDRGYRPAGGDSERPEDRQQQHPHAGGAGARRPAASRSISASPATRRKACETHLARALDCDLLVTTAGISVGEHDFVRSVLEELGARAAILEAADAARRPGGVRPAGRDPLGRPARQPGEHHGHLRALRPPGHPEDDGARPSLPADACRCGLAEPISSSRSCSIFSGDRERGTRRPRGPPHRPQGSGILTSMTSANALLIIPEGQFETPVGATVQAPDPGRPGAPEAKPGSEVTC